MVASEIDGILAVASLELGEELIPASILVPIFPVLTTRPEVMSEVTVASEEKILPVNVEGVEDGDNTKKGGVLVSCTEEDFDDESFSDLVLLTVDISVWVRL